MEMGKTASASKIVTLGKHSSQLKPWADASRETEYPLSNRQLSIRTNEFQMLGPPREGERGFMHGA